MEHGEVYHFDFRTGEARLLTAEEHRAMVVEQMRRTKIKDGIMYVDCEPPEDEPTATR
jgi:hypothetical protein